MLTTDLDGEDEKDKGALDNLLSQLIAELGMDKKVTFESLCEKQALRSVFYLPRVEKLHRVAGGDSPLRPPALQIH